MASLDGVTGQQLHTEQVFHIPDFVSRWPWRRVANRHEDEVEAECQAWLRNFSRLAGDSAWKNIIDTGFCGYWASGMAPNLNKEQLRSSAELTYLFFVMDEHTDRKPVGYVREMVEIVKESIRDPFRPRPQGEDIIGQIFKEYALRAHRVATPTSLRHFLDSIPVYLDALVTQAQDRESGHNTLTVQNYLDQRRPNAGGRSIFFVGEIALTIPDDAYHHPAIDEMRDLAIDMMVLDNDVLSYNKELAENDVGWNLLNIVMREANIGINEAIAKLHEWHLQKQRRFIKLIDEVPSFGPAVDQDLSEYIFHMANFVQSHNWWAKESMRYFVDVGPEVPLTTWGFVARKETSNK